MIAYTQAQAVRVVQFACKLSHHFGETSGLSDCHWWVVRTATGACYSCVDLNRWIRQLPGKSAGKDTGQKVMPQGRFLLRAAAVRQAPFKGYVPGACET